jgi:co-chaperonin GroES (HSP10)
MGFQLLGKRVAVELDKPQDVTPGGIALVGASKPNTGTVIAIGEEVSTSVKGRVLLEHGYPVREANIGNKKVIILDAENILATL